MENFQKKVTCDLPKVGLFSSSLNGHRGAYLDFTAKTFNGVRLSQNQLKAFKLPVFFLMVEDSFGLYLHCALWRALRGRRTVGLLFRPLPALHGSTLRLKLKALALRALKSFRQVRTIAIIPQEVIADLALITTGGIHDLQLWDLSAADRQKAASGEGVFGDLIRATAQGRRVLLSMGAQTHEKGLTFLAAAAPDLAQAGWMVVAAGKFPTSMQDERNRLAAAGHLVVDRFLTDSELLEGYGAATAVWCMYDQSYDQASGILGRAVQLGLPTLLRAGSVSHALCVAISAPFVSAQSADEIVAALDRLPSAKPALGMQLQEQFRNESIEHLTSALFEPMGPKA